MINDFLDLIYPRICYACSLALRKGEVLICVKCKLNLPFTNFHEEKENPIAKKFFGKVKLEHAFSFLHFIKGGKVQKLLHALKYNDRPEIGLILGKWYGAELHGSNLPFYDVVVPVPMHLKKQRIRGYNQVDTFAEGLAFGLKTNWKPDILLKIDQTESQTRKGRFDRFKNAEHVFKLNESYNINQLHILLVDDVVTTGSTLEACAKILIHNGAIVSIATIAHAK